MIKLKTHAALFLMLMASGLIMPRAAIAEEAEDDGEYVLVIDISRRPGDPKPPVKSWISSNINWEVAGTAEPFAVMGSSTATTMAVPTAPGTPHKRATAQQAGIAAMTTPAQPAQPGKVPCTIKYGSSARVATATSHNYTPNLGRYVPGEPIAVDKCSSLIYED